MEYYNVILKNIFIKNRDLIIHSGKYAFAAAGDCCRLTRPCILSCRNANNIAAASQLCKRYFVYKELQIYKTQRAINILHNCFRSANYAKMLHADYVILSY